MFQQKLFRIGGSGTKNCVLVQVRKAEKTFKVTPWATKTKILDPKLYHMNVSNPYLFANFGLKEIAPRARIASNIKYIFNMKNS